eukprot:1466939-Prymnesium_polylepis.2
MRSASEPAGGWGQTVVRTECTFASVRVQRSEYPEPSSESVTRSMTSFSLLCRCNRASRRRWAGGNEPVLYDWAHSRCSAANASR